MSQILSSDVFFYCYIYRAAALAALGGACSGWCVAAGSCSLVLVLVGYTPTDTIQNKPAPCKTDQADPSSISINRQTKTIQTSTG